MRSVLGFVLLLLAIPIFVGGAFEIEGIMGMPSILWAYALTIAAQLLTLAAGYVAAPKQGGVSVVRVFASVLFLIGALALPRVLVIAAFQKIQHVEGLDLGQLTWAFVESLLSIALLLYSVKEWRVLQTVKRGRVGQDPRE